MILTVVSYIWLATTVIVGGLFYPNYNHIVQFMSELGATRVPHADLINHIGFLGTELLLFAALGIAFTKLPKTPPNLIGFVFLVAYPALISVAAFFPCDFECRPTDPTLAHTIHIASGLCAYLCATIGLTVLSRQSGSRILKTAGIFLPIILVALLVSLTPDSPLVGILQRLAETLLYIWILFWLPTLSNNPQNLT